MAMEIHPSNRKYIFKWWIFHCYVSLPEGSSTRFLGKMEQGVDRFRWCKGALNHPNGFIIMPPNASKFIHIMWNGVLQQMKQ